MVKIGLNILIIFSPHGWLVGWSLMALSAISCHAEISLLKIFISFKKLKIYCLGALIKMWESLEC